MTMDELHGILTAYEMRITQRGPSKRESAYKASKESRKLEGIQKNHPEDSDDEEALFIKKLKRGTGKYKGKLPLKCCNCGKIGHFASNCPHPKPDDSDEENSKKSKKKKFGNKKFYNKKKIFYSMEDSEDEDTSEDEET